MVLCIQHDSDKLCPCCGKVKITKRDRKCPRCRMPLEWFNHHKGFCDDPFPEEETVTVNPRN